MTKSTPQETLDIEGSAGIHQRVSFLKLGAVILLAVVGWGLWSLGGGAAGLAQRGDQGPALLGVTCGVAAVVLAMSLAFCKERHVYLDLSAREIVFVLSRAWCRVGTRRRPLTEFDAIVVRHLCHSNAEGPDTYTGSVGLRPVDRGAVLWVKSFPTTEDEVPRDAFEFARKLQAMTGLPVAGTAEFNQESQRA